MIALRAARAEDRAALLALWVAAWREVFPEIDFEARVAWFATHLDDWLAKGAALTVAQDVDGIAGFTLFDAASGVMDQLCIAPRAQGRGATRALMAALKADSPRIALTVNRDNARALRYYEREGFRVTGESVNPRSGLPILAMEWRKKDGDLQRDGRQPGSPPIAPPSWRATVFYAGLQVWFFATMALMATRSFRMTATMATLKGFPALVSRW